MSNYDRFIGTLQRIQGVLSAHKKVVVAVIVVAIGLYFALTSGDMGQGAVVSNAPECARIGGSILDSGGSAVDAAIATLLCEGVVLPQSMGIGGGFVATVYDHKSKKVETLIARESAPLAATENMYVKRKITGAIAAAVPGEILGYWALHRKYGKLPWKTLFQPTIEFCISGHPVSPFMHRALKKAEKIIKKEQTMAEIFINPNTGKVWETDNFITRPKLGRTLAIIAEKGASAMYKGGEIGKKLVQDVQAMGGIITEQDLIQYKVAWDPPVVTKISAKYTLYSTPLPTSGAVLAFIMNIVSAYEYDHKNRDIYWQRIVESFKHAYGQRSKLGDVHFEPDVKAAFKNITNLAFAAYIRKMIFDDRTSQDYEYYGEKLHTKGDFGTCNVAVLHPNGDALVVTSSINTYFGAKVRSPQTGIILNDEMDDFSTPGTVNAYGFPASPSNWIKPKKRPMSSMCPSIILDKDRNVRLLIGGSGGSNITTSVSQIIIRYLILGEEITKAVQTKRIHHQLAPMSVQYENGADEKILKYLKKVGHIVVHSSTGYFSAVTAIAVKCGIPVAVYDDRRGGSVSIVDPKK